MALVKSETLAAQARGFGRLPMVRQLGLLIGLAVSVAIGVAIALWSQKPEMSLLYGGLAGRDASEVAEALGKAQIPYQLEAGGGQVLVPSAQVHEARLKLAALGLPRGGGAGAGLELLDEESGFGVSQFMENARYQRALEGELARTVASLGGVAEARVHLALVKPSVFLRERSTSSASVVAQLYPGRALDDGQVAAIVHLVAGSVPNLDPAAVTVVDQGGNLLTENRQNREYGLTDTQFKHTRRLEETYSRRIEELFTPLLGAGKARAQVVAELDFTVSEETSERFKPEQNALRSEQTQEEISNGALGAQGIPGALSNTPPGAGTTDPARAQAAENATGETASAQNSSKQATRNYEVDRSVSHTRPGTGNIKRLSVAVLLDHKTVVGKDGKSSTAALSNEDIERYTALVKEAVGFSEQRGDTVKLINAPFQVAAEAAPTPEAPFWEAAWFASLMKQIAGGIGVLLLFFMVLRPALRALVSHGRAAPHAVMGADGSVLALPGGSVGDDRLSLSAPNTGGVPALAAQSNYDQHLAIAKGLVSQDPKRVAQVVKNWVGTDA
jgi:flagellar M-ring protein FliF